MARPLRSQPPESDPAEPRLEVIPGRLDEPAEAEDKAEKRESATPAITQDPLKLYVRQIGDGRLLTPQE